MSEPPLAALRALVSAAASEPAEATVSLRDRLLASRTRKGRYGLFVDRVARLFDLPVPETEALLARIESDEAWGPFLVPGTAIIPVVAGPRRAGAIATMVRVAPGVTFPEHTHRGVETMVVVDGGFVEAGSPVETWRGEEITRDDGTSHALVGLPGVPCVAAVLITGHADFA
ncbi:MAG: cupin domain-containing protein [Labilithrix sp.]|nr:cupin domain-containing protein [Labilithrix sp.]MCW5817474.1 cupin domain-containing protein [Labilithrix sp.]